MEIASEIINNLNKPIFHTCISSKTHKIFIKYTNLKFRQYSLSIIKNLCQKSPYNNKNSIFYQTLLFHDIVLYNCGNEILISNFDLLIFSCFTIAIKSLCEQYHILKINDLKNIYREKFYLYKNDEIISNEIMCLKLLDYNINYMSSYDYLEYFIKDNNNNNNKVLFEYAKNELEHLINGNIKYYVFKSPYTIANEILNKTKEKFKIKSIILPIPTSRKTSNNLIKAQNENNSNKKLTVNSPIKKYYRKDIYGKYSRTKLIKSFSNICDNNSTNNIFTQANTLMNSPNISPNKNEFHSSINNLKCTYKKKELIGSFNNIFEMSPNNLDDRKTDITEKLGYPVNFVNIKNNPINIDFKYLSSMSKKIHNDKFIIYNPKNKNCFYKKKLNFDNVNNKKIIVNE
jgi:hypothetical protein